MPSTQIMALVCKNSNISEEDWLHCLIEIDQHIMELDVISDNLIIISLPYALEDTEKALSQYISDNFVEESMLFCCDMIIEYVVASKVHIAKERKRYNTSQKNEPKHGEVANREYDELISTNGLVIIDTTISNFVSLPRNVQTLHKSWKATWNDANDKAMMQIFGNIDSECIKNHFDVISNAWSRKTDFSEISLCGYLCDGGEIVRAEILVQNKANGKLFVHFDTNAEDHSGFSYVWLDTPNERLCAPPKHNGQFQSLYSGYNTSIYQSRII